MKPQNKPKKPAATNPFGAQMARNLANASGNMFSLQEEYKNLENPSPAPQNNPKPKTNSKVPINSASKKSPIKAPNKQIPKQVASPNKNNNNNKNNEEEHKAIPLETSPIKRDIHGISLKKDKPLFKDRSNFPENNCDLNVEGLTFSKDFLIKIKFPLENSSKLPSLSAYYYKSLFSAALQKDTPCYFRFNKDNTKFHKKYAEVLKNTEKSSSIYKDPKFPPQKNWKSPEEFLNAGEIKLFQEFSQYSIVQGSLGDCYLMGSLIVLSEKPQRLKKLFINDYNKYGLYGIWICESGNWRLILIDHTIPCYENSGPCYARTKNNELWVMLLEKAYAKTYLGYQKIILGFAGDALKDLTGAPSEYIDLKDEKKAWESMVYARKNNFVLCASTKSNQELDSNLVSKHNYAVLTLKEVKKGELWLKLQNPLQTFSWKSQINMSSDVQKALDLNPADDKNGIFWLHFNEFRDNFEVVTCNKIHSDYYYSFLKIPQKNGNNPCFIRAIVLQKTHCYFSIHQKHARFFKDEKEKHFYCLSRIIVCSLVDNKIAEVINGDFSVKQTAFTEIWLEPGEYLIYGEIDFQKNSCEQITISAYSSLPIVLDLLPVESLDLKPIEILQQIFVLYLIKNPKDSKITKYETENIVKYNGTLWGFVYFLYVNESLNMSLYEVTNLTKCENLTMFWPNSSKQNTHFEICCNSNEFKLVLYKIGYLNNGSHACSMNNMINLSENLNDKNLIEKTLKEGVSSKRTNDVTFYNYKFKGGNSFLYQNKGKALYKEILTFKVLENIEIILENGIENKKRNEVDVKVQPDGGIFLLRLNIKNPFEKKSGFNYTFLS